MIKKIGKNVVTLVLSLLFVLLPGLDVDAHYWCPEFDYNTKNIINLYYVSSSYKSFFTLPESATKYEFDFSKLSKDAVIGVVSGNEDIVIVEGNVIKTNPKYNFYGDEEIYIGVFDGENRWDFKVNIIDYSMMYANCELSKVYRQCTVNTSDKMEMLENFTKWVANNTDHNNIYHYYLGMMITKSGSCWSSSEVIWKLCSKAGIKAGLHAAPNSMSDTHRNVICQIDGKNYIAEAGYTGNKPRSYSIYETSEEFKDSYYNDDGKWYTESDTVAAYKTNAKYSLIPSQQNTDSGNSTSNKSEKTKKRSNEWVDGKWYNADGSQTYKGTMKWKCNSKGWWIEDSAGWYPKSQWQKIDGKWYYFCSDGYMDYSEYRDGCWLGSDGAWVESYSGGKWYLDSTGWWYSDSSGWYPANQWLWIDGTNYHFNAKGYCTNP